MNTIFHHIRHLILSALTGAACSLAAQNALLPHVDIRSAAHPVHKVKAAAVQFNLLALSPEGGDPQGHYALYTINDHATADYALTPVKDGDPLEGVNAYDLARIARHIQLAEPFEEPWQWIAADIDRDNAVTYRDIQLLRRLMLDPSSELTDNQSWRFYDTRYVFPLPFPLDEPIPESVETTRDAWSGETFRFYAVKVGDVDGSATRNLEEPGAADRSSLAIPKRVLFAGESMELVLTLSEAATLSGLQGALQLDPAVIRVEAVYQGNTLGMSGESAAVYPAQGLITFSWFDAFPQYFSEQDDFLVIRLKALADVTLSQAIAYASESLAPTAFDGSGNAQPLQLRLSDGATLPGLHIEKKALSLKSGHKIQVSPEPEALLPIEE